MLKELRLKYKPPLPENFADLKTLTFAKKETPAVKKEIEKLFPKTSNQSVVQAQTGNPQTFSPLKVGVVFSGGPASGGHNVIAGLFDALQALHPSSQLFGFLDGPSGIVHGKTLELTAEKIAGYRNLGGFDLLSSGRTKIESDEQLASSLKTAQNLGLDGLVIIGGDDSNTNAAVIAEYFLKHGCQTRVVGVPKTIDGDLQNPYVEISFGFDTAAKIYSEMIGNLGRDALSSKKYYHFIKLMGRSASHLALECGLKTHPNLTLISEERRTLAEITKTIADLVEQRSSQKKNHGLILIPEGLIEYMPEMAELIDALNKGSSTPIWDTLPTRIQQQLLLDKDPHGNVNLSAVETELLLIECVKTELKKRGFKGSFNPLTHFFGYEGRCGMPSNFDANYCLALGYTAALLIAHNLTSYMAFVHPVSRPVREWSVGGLPLTSQMELHERKGKLKPVIGKAYVDLQGKPYARLKQNAAKWALEDDYHSPGPIQFFGDPALTDSIPIILQC